MGCVPKCCSMCVCDPPLLSAWRPEPVLEPCLQSPDTLSLYRLGLRSLMDTLRTDREKLVMKEVPAVNVVMVVVVGGVQER